MRGDTAILRYAHEGWRFERVSADARLFWTDLALHLNATGTPSLAVEQADDLDTLFERHRTTQPFVEELVQQHLLIRSMDGCLICPYLLQMEEKRQGGFHPHARRPASRVRKRAEQRGEEHIDRRSVTSRLNGMKSKGRPRKSKSVSGQRHMMLPIAGGLDENLNNLKNAELGYSGYVQSQHKAVNSGKLGFEGEKVGFCAPVLGQENNNNFCSSPSSIREENAKKPKKPNSDFSVLRSVPNEQVFATTRKAIEAAGLSSPPGFEHKQVPTVRQWLNAGLEEADILAGIKDWTAYMHKQGRKPLHMGFFKKTMLRLLEGQVAELSATKKQGDLEWINLAKEARVKDIKAWQKRYDYDHSIFGKIPFPASLDVYFEKYRPVA